MEEKGMGLAETYRSVRPGIVAFAPKYPERIRSGAIHFEFVFGTGFIVDDSLIATNAHVVNAFNEFQRHANNATDVVGMAFVPTSAGMATILLDVVDACAVTRIQSSG